LGDKQKITNFKISDKVFKASSKVDLGEFAWVERTNKIMIEKENSAGGISAFTGGLFRGLTYALVTSPKTGKVWLDRNLGATQVATSSNDTDAYGDLYQWGRAKDGHESIVGTATTIAIATNLNPVNNGAFILTNAQPNDWVAGVDNDGALRTVAWADGGVNDICPAGFSVPTKAELKEDIIDAGITSVATAFSSPLKLPAAGYRNRATGDNGTIHDSGIGIGSGSVFLWSRSVDGSQASYLSVINSIVNSNNLVESRAKINNFSNFSLSSLCR
jgi:uncharacterized protein (TIGR02145 family)